MYEDKTGRGFAAARYVSVLRTRVSGNMRKHDVYDCVLLNAPSLGRGFTLLYDRDGTSRVLKSGRVVRIEILGGQALEVHTSRSTYLIRPRTGRRSTAPEFTHLTSSAPR